MRLRLRIERNELPAVNVLWTVDPTALKQTVAQFLQRVDERVPLEGESWGLEDYAVAVGGYEAFHYSEVGDCFQNEDEVIIKPLQYVDVRARSMTGRDQISSNGMHLMDGVPFGKPLLKRPRRPDVRIPPRKRARLEVQDGDEEDDDDEADEETLAITMAGQGDEQLEDEDEDDEDDEEDDEDFEMAEDENGSVEEEDEEDGEEEQAPVKPRRSMRRRLIADEAEEHDEDDEDDEDESEDSDSSDDTSADESTSSDSSVDSSSDSDDASSEASWDGIQASPAKQSAQSLVNGNGGLATGRLLSSDTVSFTPPFEGTLDTKMRNARRREQRRLKYLKETGALPPDATMDDMRSMKQLQGGSSRSELGNGSQSGKTKAKDAGDQQTIEEARQRLVESIAAGGIDVSEAGRTSTTNGGQSISGAAKMMTNGSNKRRDANTGEEEASDNDEPPDKLSSAPPAPTIANLADENEALDVEEAPAARRARINLQGANRLVFGSLGVRTPRSQADKDALQKKLSARASRNAPSKEVKQPQTEVEEDEDPEAWRENIVLSAVECCDEGVELSAPPFPFQQRWDPQYQYSKKRKKSGNSKASKARKIANGAGTEFVESYDKYNNNGGSDALNYDDPEDEAEDDSYWEEGALLGDEDQESIESVDDGFPSLPEDLTALADVVESDAREGDFVTYKQLICSAATNWTPTTVNRTAKLGSRTEDGTWNVVYATRDKRPKEFDGEGNRIYSKFEMEGMSDDEDEEVENTLAWAAMQEPKLLKRAVTES